MMETIQLPPPTTQSARERHTDAALAALLTGLRETGEQRTGNLFGLMLAGNAELSLDHDRMAISLHRPKRAIADVRDPTGYNDVDDIRLLSRILTRAADAIDPPTA